MTVRKQYISRAIIDIHGRTDGCAACEVIYKVYNACCKRRFEHILQRTAAQASYAGRSPIV